jgi:Na+-driven multidrug efflux pump
METTLIKSKLSKRTLIKISLIILILFISSLVLFTNSSILEFIKRHTENINSVYTAIIMFILFVPLIGFLIPNTKSNGQGRSINSFNGKRRILESRRKNSLKRLMDANRR